jgi:predicted nucleic acid-binding protein
VNFARPHLIDTNIFIYSFDASEPRRKARALQVIERVVLTRTAMLSTQVLGETFVNLMRLAGTHLTRSEAAMVVERMARIYPIGAITRELALTAIDLTLRYSLSYYDALLCAVASEHGASNLLTEDMQAEQVIDGVRILHVLEDDFDLSRLD